MIWSTQRHPSLIGVVIDSRFLRAVQLGRAAGRWRLEAALCLPRMKPGASLDGQDVAQLAGALARQGFRGRQIVLAVPEDTLVTDILELPPRGSGAPLEEIARAELAHRHGYDPQAAEMACWDLPPVSRAKAPTQAMAVACRHADAEVLLEVFERTDLEVAALDTHLHALVRVCRPAPSEAGISAIMDVEWDWAALVLLYRGTIVYRAMIPEAAVGRLAQALSERLHLEADVASGLLFDVGMSILPPVNHRGPNTATAPDDAVSAFLGQHFDKVAAAMRPPFAYCCRQYGGEAAEDLLVTGHGAAVHGAGESLQARLGVSVRTIAPRDVAQCPPTLGAKADDPSLVVPIGLAQYA